ncbi:superoxide dismutase family protein [Tsuneonella suprasediminis]|uniref:superoxide dismutase family protein n=1 Tax=Tsuneonella suprasediminis TaxID=2306996 RepID=UPI002F9551B6
MTILKTAIGAGALAVLGGCTTMQDLPTERIGSATISLPNGMPAGTAQLLGSGDGVSVAVALTGIPAGDHGIHLHMVGKCTVPDFTSAGGHLNPQGKDHGSMAAGGKHLGDLPNIAITGNGTGTLNARLTGTRQEVIDAIFDSDGTAIVVHADPDDNITNPSGNSGARIACGVFKRS